MRRSYAIVLIVGLLIALALVGFYLLMGLGASDATFPLQIVGGNPAP